MTKQRPQVAQGVKIEGLRAIADCLLIEQSSFIIAALEPWHLALEVIFGNLIFVYFLSYPELTKILIYTFISNIFFYLQWFN